MRPSRTACLALTLALGGAGCALIDAMGGSSDARTALDDGGGDGDSGGTPDGRDTVDAGSQIPFESAQLWAVHPPIAQMGTTVRLEGEFSTTSTNLVGLQGTAVELAATVLGVPRATIAVQEIPFFSGEITVSAETTTSHPAELRLTSFALGLSRFQNHYEQTNGARTMPVLDEPRAGHTAHVRGRWVYVIGGSSNGRVARAVINADGTLTPFKEMAAELVQPRLDHVSVLLGDFIYVLGGQYGGSTLASVERATLMPESGDVGNFGTYSRSLVTDRSGAAAVVVGSYLYVLGGVSDSAGGVVSSIERAEILEGGELGPFELIGPQLTAARKLFTAHVLGDFLYAIGGRNAESALTDVDRATISPNGDLSNFSPQSPLQQQRAGHVSIALADRLYVIGGADIMPMDVVEAATVDASGNLGSFSATGLSLPDPRTDAAAVIAGNDLYLLGGRHQASASTSIVRGPIALEGGLSGNLEVASGTLYQARRGHSVAASGDHVYTFGGVESGDDFIGGALANPDGNLALPFQQGGQWDNARSGTCTAVLGDRIYLIGGADQTDTASDLVEHDSFENGVATPLDPSTRSLTTPRKWTACVAANGYLVVIGGKDSSLLGTLERAPYDAAGNLTGDFEVISGTSLQTARHKHSVAVLGDYLYVIGGIDLSDQPINSIERATLTSDGSVSAFSSYGILPTNRAGHASIAIGRRLYVLGGGAQTDFDVTTVDAEGAIVFPFEDAPPSLFQGREAPAVITVGHLLYVLGGAGGATPTNVIYKVMLSDG